MLLRTVACALCAVMICPAAQSANQQPAVPLKIVVLQGEGAVNNIKTKTVIEPVVEVRNDRDLPVAGVTPRLRPGFESPIACRRSKRRLRHRPERLLDGEVDGMELMVARHFLG